MTCLVVQSLPDPRPDLPPSALTCCGNVDEMFSFFKGHPEFAKSGTAWFYDVSTLRCLGF